MDFKTLQKAVANLSWELNFYDFCRSILEKDFSSQELELDPYCQEKWKDWQKLNSALHAFDNKRLERNLEVYQRRADS